MLDKTDKLSDSDPLTKSNANPDAKLFVLDTNVLMHDPGAIFRFHEHDLFIPMVVVEELDTGKKRHLGSCAQCAPGKPLLGFVIG